MEVLIVFWCLTYCFVAVASDDSTPDPNRIKGEVTKPDNSDLTVGIALAVGTFLLLLAFLIVLIINKVRNRRQLSKDTTEEHGESNGKNNSDNNNMIPLHQVNTISVQDEVPKHADETVVTEKVEEVQSASVTRDTPNYDNNAAEANSVAITEPEEPRQENHQNETNFTSVLAGGAVVGGAGLIGSASLLNSDNSDDPAPDLNEQIEDTTGVEVIENATEPIEREINDNQIVESAFMIGADSESDMESERYPEDTEETAFPDPPPPPPPPSVDYLESVEHEQAEEAHDDEYPNVPVFPTEDGTREFAEENVITDHSQIDDADIEPTNDEDFYSNTDQIEYNRDVSDDVPGIPYDHHETTPEQTTAYSNQVESVEHIRNATTNGTAASTNSSQSEYLRSLLPPPLDMDNIIIISKD